MNILGDDSTSKLKEVIIFALLVDALATWIFSYCYDFNYSSGRHHKHITELNLYHFKPLYPLMELYGIFHVQD